MLAPGRYRIRWWDDVGNRRSVVAATPTLVRRRWLEARADMEPAPAAEAAADRRAWRQARGWLTYWAGTGRPEWRGGTRRRHYHYLTAYVLKAGAWRGLALDKVDEDNVRELLAQAATHCGDPLTGASKKHLLSSLSIAFREAERRGLMTDNPCEGFQLGEDTQSRPVAVVQPEDTPLFIGLCRDAKEAGAVPDADALELLLWTGIRSGELRALHWDAWLRHWADLRRDDERVRVGIRQLTVEASMSSCLASYRARRDRNETKPTACTVRGLPKGGKPRTLRLNEQAASILSVRWQAARPNAGEPIFPAARGGYMTAVGLSQTLKQLREYEESVWPNSTTRIVPKTVHSLRHSATVRLLQSGKVTTIAQALGHRDGGRLILERYGRHEVPDDLVALADADKDVVDEAWVRIKSESIRKRPWPLIVDDSGDLV